MHKLKGGGSTRREEIIDETGESGVIASLIRNPEFYIYDEGLLPEHFSNQTNRKIYETLIELASNEVQQIDAFAIIDCMKSNRIANDVSVEQVQEYIDISDLIARNTPESYKIAARGIVNAAFRRDALDKLVECEKLCFDRDLSNIESKIYEKLDGVMLKYSTGIELPEYKDVIDELWAEIEARQRGDTSAIEFPFENLNKYVVMEPGECICFAAPQKAGKSAMLLTCTVDMLRNKHKSVLYIDSELSDRLFTMRMIAHLTKIPFGKIRGGGCNTVEEKELIEAAKEEIKSWNFIHYYAPMMDENQLYLMAKRAKHKIDIDVIVLDYLKANSSDDQAYSVYSSLGRLSDTLKNKIAGDMNICALTAAQATATGKIADSAKIARNVSTVITIADKTFEEMQADNIDKATKKLRVLFNRNGNQMNEDEYIDMAFEGGTCTYWETPEQHQILNPF